MVGNYSGVLAAVEVSDVGNSSSDPIDAKQQNQLSLQLSFDPDGAGTILGDIQVEVSDDNGREPGSSVISIMNWAPQGSPVAIDTSSETLYYIPIESATGNWFRVTFLPDGATDPGNFVTYFSAKK